MSHQLPIIPSNDPLISEQQLCSAIRNLNSAQPDQTVPQYRPYLQQILRRAWDAAVGETKDGTEPSVVLARESEILARTSAGLVGLVQEGVDPRVRAAIELFGAIGFLQTGLRALKKRALRKKILKANERDVLKVLSKADTYLQRKEVHRKLPLPTRNLSAPRVGQLLSDLYHDGYLIRYHAQVQGGETSFYALGPSGRKLLEEKPCMEETPWNFDEDLDPISAENSEIIRDRIQLFGVKDLVELRG